MGRIRNSKTKYRGIFIVVVVLLAISLVGTFARWSAPTTNKSDDATSTDVLQKQIAALITTIDNEKAATGTKGYSENIQIAEDLSTLAETYAKVGDSANMNVSAKEAVEYFQAAYDSAPAELNAAGKAQILSKKAAATYMAGDAEAAKSTYNEAIAADPLNWEANIGYATVVYNASALAGGSPDFQGALDYLKGYQEKLGQDSEHASELAGYISNIEAQKEAAAASGTTNSGTTNSGTASGSTTGTSGN